MRLAQTVLLASLLAVGAACGYSHSTMPAAPGTVPTIVSLNPSSVIHGTAAFSLTVNGSSFNGTAVVNFNGAPMSTMWTNSGQVVASIPASAIMNANTVPVTVTNPGTGGGYGGGGTQAATSAAMNFTID